MARFSSYSHHGCATYIASLCSSGHCDSEYVHLHHAVDIHVSVSDRITASLLSTSPLTQKVSRLDDHRHLLFDKSSLTDRACRHIFSI